MSSLKQKILLCSNCNIHLWIHISCHDL